MMVGFTPESAERIADTVRIVERMPGNTSRGSRRRNNTPPARLVLRGKLDGTLNKDSSATMSVWRYNGSAEADTSENVTVYDWMLKTGQTIASGKKVVAEFFLDSGRWYVIAAECP